MTSQVRAEHQSRDRPEHGRNHRETSDHLPRPGRGNPEKPPVCRARAAPAAQPPREHLVPRQPGLPARHIRGRLGQGVPRS